MTDFTYSLGKIIIISSIELEVAVMVANAPSMKIIFVQLFGTRKNIGVYPSRQSLSDFSKSRKIAGPSSTCRVTSSYSPDSAAPVDTEAFKNGHESSEAILRLDSITGIFVTSSIAIDRHDAQSSRGLAEICTSAKPV